MENKPRKNHITKILLFLMFAVGLSLLLYPTFADWWNSFHASRVVDSYQETVANLSNDEYQQMLDEAADFNNRLLQSVDRFNDPMLKDGTYERILNVDDRNMIGSIEIPSLNIKLPIYHGTSDAVLGNSIGHLEGTTFPIGGKGTHAALSGHRGLPSAKLFTDLDQMEEGDYFMIHVLDNTYTYEVDHIAIVEPEDLSLLQADPEQDYVTLITCTPYGINTHRLLVRGHRVDNLPGDYINTRNEAIILNRNVVAIVIASFILIILFILLIIFGGKKKLDVS